MPERTHAVLIIDDVQADRFLLKEAIRKHAPRFQVVAEVTNGEDAVAYLAGEGEFANRSLYPIPDLMFLDIRMPRMNGIEVMEWLLTRDFPALTVVVLADPTTPSERLTALSLGAKYVFPKSLNPSILSSSIGQLQAEMDRPADKSEPETAAVAVPDLVVDGSRFESYGFPVIVVWGNEEVSRFMAPNAGKAAILARHYAQKDERASGAKLFTWDGTTWHQAFA